MFKFVSTVAAFGLGLAISASAFACNTLSDGEVTQVDPSGNKVTVVKADSSKTFITASKTKILINGQEATLADLKAGDKVSVDYETADDVLSIKATREG